MADETQAPKTEEPELVVEVAPDNEKPGKPSLTDEEVAKLDELPAEDEIGRYAKDAQKRIKSLHIANQEWRRRVVQSTKDVATATTLAEQLYRENQQLKQERGRNESAVIDQALLRVEAQLVSARARLRAAHAINNPDEIVAASEDVSRFVAEADRLRLLKPPAPGKEEPSGEAAPPSPPVAQPPQPKPPSEGTQAWMAQNPWFGKPGEERLTGYALGIHNELEKQGITELTDPKRYWSTIDKGMRETFPARFAQEGAKPEGARPVTVTGATRTNGAPEAPRRGPRHVTLSESQVRIARSLGLTNEQYAAQLVKEEAAANSKERVQ